MHYNTSRTNCYIVANYHISNNTYIRPNIDIITNRCPFFTIRPDWNKLAQIYIRAKGSESTYDNRATMSYIEAVSNSAPVTNLNIGIKISAGIVQNFCDLSVYPPGYLNEYIPVCEKPC